jgi:hypothetical protein
MEQKHKSRYILRAKSFYLTPLTLTLPQGEREIKGKNF